MRTRALVPSLLLVLVAVLAGGCADDNDDASVVEEAERTDEGTPVLEIAEENGNFTTLLAAIEAAQLDGTLSGDGPFTILAPPDDAFFEVGQETLDQLLGDPTGDLADILQLHVIEGSVGSTAVLNSLGECIETISGENLLVEQDGELLTLGGAIVVDADIRGANGVIHVIDRVLTEPSTDC